MRYVASYSRSLGILVGALLIMVFLTYRSFSQYLFYVSWIAALIGLVFGFYFILVRRKLSNVVAQTLIISGAWLIVALFVTPFATDVTHHTKILTVSSFYLISSAVFTDILYRTRIDIGLVFYRLMVAWFSINVILLALYVMGIYSPDKGDFSGVFHDRNVFSITSLIVISFSLSFISSFKKKKRLVVMVMAALLAGMILLSKSISGLVGLMVVLTFFSSGLSRSRRLFILLIVGILLGGVLLTDNPIKQRTDRFVLSATGQTEQLNINESAYIRIYLLTSGFKLGKENALTGVGLDNARLHVFWPDRDTGSFLHNNYLDILTSGGVVMFILYYIPIFYIFIWFILNKDKIYFLSNELRQLWKASLLMLSLKITYDLTWTTYFEFGMVFSVVFAIYSYKILRRQFNLEKNTLYS